jgi:hypothetical protein
MTEPMQHKRTESRCEHCGTIRIEFDPPLQLELDDEILRDNVFALKHLDFGDFWETTGLFWTVTGALFAMEAEIAQGTDPDRLKVEPVTVHL